MTQTKAFDIPPAPKPRGVWHCSLCGGTETSVDASRPSVDERYAVGRCRSCSRPRKTHKQGAPEGTVIGLIPLVSDSVWDPARHQFRKPPKTKLAYEEGK